MKLPPILKYSHNQQLDHLVWYTIFFLKKLLQAFAILITLLFGTAPYKYFTTFFLVNIGCLFHFCQLPNNHRMMPMRLLPQPGLTYLPASETSENETMIYYWKRYDEASELMLVQMDLLTKKYGSPGQRFGPCNAKNDYGYRNFNPCILLKVNRIIGWKLQAYERGDELPAEAPNVLKMFIDKQTLEKRKHRLWISCEHNLQAAGVKMVYYPESRSIPGHLVEMKQFAGCRQNYYDVEDYRRIIAVQFERVPREKILQIECYLWAKNVIRDRAAMKGTAKFAIQFKPRRVFGK